MRDRTIISQDRGHILFVLLLLAQFQLWDGIITQVFVGNGLAREANRLMAPLVSSGNFLALKLLGTAVLLALLWVLHKRFPRIAVTAASCMAFFYAAVIAWNFFILFRPC